MAWSIELSEFDIHFEPRGTIKSQCLADFLNELSPPGHFEDSTWVMHVDGSSNCQGSGADIILESPSGITLEQSLRFGFRASNNQAEYEALLVGMRLATEMGAKKIVCWTDSKVVADQFDDIQVWHMPRSNNERADQLARLASSRKPGQVRTTIHLELPTPSVELECMLVEEVPKSWMTEILNFIVNGTEPAEPSEAKRIRTQAAQYSVVAGELYRRGFSTPLLKCIDHQQANYVIGEIHEGICGSQFGRRTLATKVLRASYFWPTLKTDCAQFVKKCLQCQKHGNLIHASAEQLHSISSPWPFALWGIDILGPFLLVAVDYFNKWIEAEPLASITAANVQKFTWRNIITCTPQSSTKETPFWLAYGSDAMIPVEVGEPSFWQTHFHEESNDNSLRAELDVVDELREKALVVAEACKQRMRRQFNSNFQPRAFQEGDLVWRATGSARRNPSEGKLSRNWDGPDGPFRV
uniref:Gypsy retrotransposon integrase-like protein 1 n=1 Tax=Cajanus cajan TaxID=3821 RepID=A0A151SJY2_CAJCA|nr:Gypsy retrotransposon integrase-like protein 1 [Cajanus cajan]